MARRKKVGDRGKQKLGKKVKCPKCKYTWHTKQLKSNKPYICCSRCKRYFKV
jgi:acetyl-CoA carboxylase beta subunit